jgi:tRNA (mo5U34)-methyltransferase
VETLDEGRLWYHTLELGPGLVTPGYYDCRPVAEWILPRDLSGLRCLDIATFDGFWAFELEKRNAAEVVAIDILDEARWDWPAIPDSRDYAAIEARKRGGDGFLLAKERLGSNVERLDLSVYDLDPGTHGEFDLIYLGSLLLHLRDPIRALEAVRSVCSGRLISTDSVSLPLSLAPFPIAALDGRGRPYWWKPNKSAFRRMVEVAGFEVLTGPRGFRMPPGKGHPRVPISMAALRARGGPLFLFSGRYGDPHATLSARPLGGG